MSEKHQGIVTPEAPLILTVPAYSFVVALHLECLGRSNRAAFSDETFAERAEPVDCAWPSRLLKNRWRFPRPGISGNLSDEAC
jgi:hypothetical protein